MLSNFRRCYSCSSYYYEYCTQPTHTKYTEEKHGKVVDRKKQCSCLWMEEGKGQEIPSKTEKIGNRPFAHATTSA